MTAVPTTSAEVRVLYGSETGNAEFLCDDLVEELAAHGVTSSSMPLDDVDATDLAALGTALIIVSTTGDGDMPYGADTFWERLDTDDAPDCTGLHYAVLALGDRTYTYFCEAGTRIDERLAQLGATRIADRVDCDAAYDARAGAWIHERAAQLEQPAAGAAVTAGTAAVTVVVPVTHDDGSDSDRRPGDADAWDPDGWGPDVLGDERAPSDTVFGGSMPGDTDMRVAASGDASRQRSPWTREHPYAARLTRVERLSGPGPGCGDNREVIHCELDLGDSGIVPQPGDSLAVVADNAPYAVDRFLDAAGLTGGESFDGQSFLSLARDRWELRFASVPLLQAVAAGAPRTDIGILVAAANRAGLDDWVRGHTVADALSRLPAPLAPAELARLMQPVRARAYSVASAPGTKPGLAHLAVAVERPMAPTMRSGVASGLLADRLAVGDRVRMFPQPNRSFRLPDDPTAPIVMIGPGVGVAPFRAFLQQRSRDPSPGPAWLFFGNRHENGGFLYHDDWLGFREAGVLTRLDTAFSRDRQPVYVQDRMREHAAELVRWLRDGAYVYVCGDARRMAPDVDDALRGILTAELGTTAGTALLARLRDERRYRTDVY